MADNVNIITSGSTPIATDDVNGVQYQKVKINLGDGIDGGSVSSTNPLPVSASIFETASYGVTQPSWSQLPSFPGATGVAGTNMISDNVRYIYTLAPSNTTTATFWRYDTFFATWQQLATPPTTTISLGALIYTKHTGSSVNGVCQGTVYSFQANGTICYFYRYNIGTNTWATLSTTNIPADFGTSASMVFPSPENNGNLGGYHIGTLGSITTTASASANSTIVSVNALPSALAVGTVLNFGPIEIHTTSSALVGETTISVLPIPEAIGVGTTLTLLNGSTIIVTNASPIGATTLSILPIQNTINSGTTLTVARYAVLTQAAGISDTGITVSPLATSISAASNALHYDHMYLLGNNATQLYRYSISSNTWTTTSANAGNAALAPLLGAPATGCALVWDPMYDANKLIYLRGNSSSNMYYYDLVSNTWMATTYIPDTETFGIGTWVTTRTSKKRKYNVLIQKDTSSRFLEFNPYTATILPKATQSLLTTGAATVGNRMVTMVTPTGEEYVYILLHSSTSLLRTALVSI